MCQKNFVIQIYNSEPTSTVKPNQHISRQNRVDFDYDKIKYDEQLLWNSDFFSGEKTLKKANILHRDIRGKK